MEKRKKNWQKKVRKTRMKERLKKEKENDLTLTVETVSDVPRKAAAMKTA